MTDQPDNAPQYDPAADLPDPQFRFEDLKPYDQQFLEQLLIHGHPSKASLAVGRKSNYGKWVLETRPEVAAVWDQMRLDRSRKLGITAEDVLRALWSMATADKSDILNDDGTVRPISEWPETFRQGAGLVAGFDVEETSERSHDGETVDKSGGWDKKGKITKVRFVDPLKLVELLGRHVNVKAFPDSAGKLADAIGDLAGSIDSAIAEGRQRVARRLK